MTTSQGLTPRWPRHWIYQRHESIWYNYAPEVVTHVPATSDTFLVSPRCLLNLRHKATAALCALPWPETVHIRGPRTLLQWSVFLEVLGKQCLLNWQTKTEFSRISTWPITITSNSSSSCLGISLTCVIILMIINKRLKCKICFVLF